MIVGQLSSKYGMLLKAGSGGFDLYNISTLFLVVGYLALILRGVVWVKIVGKADISLVYPLMSLALVVILFVSNLLFDEEVSMLKAIGATVIISGTFLVSRTKE